MTAAPAPESDEARTTAFLTAAVHDALDHLANTVDTVDTFLTDTGDPRAGLTAAAVPHLAAMREELTDRLAGTGGG